MSDFAHGNSSTPGTTVRVTSQVRRFLEISEPVVKRGVSLDEASQDAANTPVTKLRPGLVVVKVVNGGANDGKYVPIGHADAPVANDIVSGGAGAVILSEFVNMLGEDGTVEDKWVQGYIACYPTEAQVIFGTADQATIDAIKAAMPNAHFI